MKIEKDRKNHTIPGNWWVLSTKFEGLLLLDSSSDKAQTKF